MGDERTMADEMVNEIILPIHRSRSIRLHEEVASAEINGEDFRYSQAVGDGTLMFWVGGRQYEITTQDLCEAVLAYDRDHGRSTRTISDIEEEVT